MDSSPANATIQGAPPSDRSIVSREAMARIVSREAPEQFASRETMAP
jgi:hypothetical protein